MGLNKSLHLYYPEASLSGTVQMERSKSISNRVLLIRAICTVPFDMQHLSHARDTKTLASLIWSEAETLDTGDAGTCFRFLTAYLCTRWTTHILTGSERMLQRPIGPLVEALQTLGAQIEYLDKPGFPPIRIKGTRHFGLKNDVEIDPAMSSQFISALMLIAPALPYGLSIHLLNDPVSAPYIEMTRSVMEYFSVKTDVNPGHIRIEAQKYQPRDISIESDWSGASYFYSLAVLANAANIELVGLEENSWQGDQIIATWMLDFGIQTVYNPKGASITKVSDEFPEFLEIDFTKYPDLAQTMIVLCAALGVSGLFYGLETLHVKETDRILALKTELAKMGVQFYKSSRKHTKQKERIYYILDGKAQFPEHLEIETYGDHRMAMAFAPLALLHPIEIKNADIVKKSFPGFWRQIEKIALWNK